jgi:hypothetical protein
MDMEQMRAELTDDEAQVAAALAVPERFEVRDRDAAEWLVRKLIEAEAHIKQVRQQADRELRRTERERDFLLMRYGPQLERWTRLQVDQTQGRRKSVLLLSGTVGFRRIPAKLVVDDAMKAIAWARQHCLQAVVVTEKLNKTSLAEHVHETGELPDGARIQSASERFYAK